MDDGILLNELRALAANTPDFSTYSANSKVHNQWLGKVVAYTAVWDRYNSTSIKSAVEFIGIAGTREFNLSKIMTGLYQAISDLQIKVGVGGDRAFSHGEVYKFFVELRELISRCEQELFIVDPYTDPAIFDAYFSALPIGVRGHLLTMKPDSPLDIALAKFTEGGQRTVEVKRAPKKSIHDRVIFLDRRTCYVSGQSIKDAAKNSPTYLMPLAGDAFDLKLAAYEDLWNSSTPI